jgi:hypothetical protein
MFVFFRSDCTRVVLYFEYGTLSAPPTTHTTPCARLGLLLTRFHLSVAAGRQNDKEFLIFMFAGALNRSCCGSQASSGATPRPTPHYVL